MFQMLMDYLSMPAETGNTAREAIFIALKLMNDDPEYSVYVMEYSGLCEIIVSILTMNYPSIGISFLFPLIRRFNS